MSDNPPIEFAFPELRKWEKGAAPYVHVFESGKLVGQTHQLGPHDASPQSHLLRLQTGGDCLALAAESSGTM